jgi:drug/metabolite transporter (DMT)-like permease
VVVGFPLLTALALRRVDASQGAVLVGMLPAATTVAAVVLHREAAPARLWLGAGIGLAVTLSHIMVGGHGATVAGQLELLAAVVLAGIGFFAWYTALARAGVAPDRPVAARAAQPDAAVVGRPARGVAVGLDDRGRRPDPRRSGDAATYGSG